MTTEEAQEQEQEQEQEQQAPTAEEIQAAVIQAAVAQQVAQQVQTPNPTERQKVPHMAGRVVSNIVNRLFAMLQTESGKIDDYRGTLQQLKDGSLTIEEIAEVTADPPPITTAAMIGELLNPLITGYFSLIEAQSAKASELNETLIKVKKGELDVQSLTITDDGILTVPPMLDEEEEVADPQPSNLNGQPVNVVQELQELMGMTAIKCPGPDGGQPPGDPEDDCEEDPCDWTDPGPHQIEGGYTEDLPAEPVRPSWGPGSTLERLEASDE